MCENPDNSINEIEFVAVPVPRTQETMYVSLTYERDAARVIVGRGTNEPADLDLEQAEKVGLALLMAVRAGHDLYDTNPSRRFNGYPSAT